MTLSCMHLMHIFASTYNSKISESETNMHALVKNSKEPCLIEKIELNLIFCFKASF